MAAYKWPGNIRELRNTLERAVLLCEKDVIRCDDLSLCWNEMESVETDTIGEQLVDSNVRLVDMEKKMILDALDKSSWIQKEAAKYLGISRRVMHYKIQKFGITNPNWVKNK